MQQQYISNAMREKEYFFDLAKMHKGFTRIQKSEKLQKEYQKRKVEDLTKVREEKMEKAKTKAQELRADAKDKFKYLSEKDVQRRKVVTEVKLAL